ncbi:MAG: DUF2721 domain-containing protein [Methylovulum sp.]|nr:DUF2721 domain-containing protein [Methylovulum sp.]
MQTVLAMQVTDMAHVIQLSVAPVFLLTGVGAILSVLTLRIGRIVDRARLLEDYAGSENEPSHTHSGELAVLARRARLANRAVSLCTICALSICMVIVALFVGAFTGLEFAAFIASLFIFAMIALILALLLFLREIYLATGIIK